MQIPKKDIKDCIFVEFLAYERNSVKMNKLYKKNKDIAYTEMQKSRINDFKFIKQSSIRKNIEYKKAIGLLEMFNKYEEEIYKNGYLEELDSSHISKELKAKFSFMQDFTMIVTGTHKDLEKVLVTEDYSKVSKDIIRNIKSSDQILFPLLGLLLIKNEQSFIKSFSFSLYEQVSECLERMVKKVDFSHNTLSEEKKKKFISLRNKYFPSKSFESTYAMHNKILKVIEKEYSNEISKESFNSLLITLQSVLEITDLDIDIVETEHTISRTDINNIFTLLAMYDIEDKYIPIFVSISFILLILGKEINNNKKLFFLNNDEIFELEKESKKKEENIQNKRITDLEKELKEKDEQISKIKKEYRITLEKEIIELQKEVSELETIIENLEMEGNNEKEDSKKDVLENNNFQSSSNAVIDDAVYIIGGYSKLINKLKVNMPNLVWMDKIYYKAVGSKVFLLSRYMTHADKYKVDSLGIEYFYLNEKGYNGLISEIMKQIKEA